MRDEEGLLFEDLTEKIIDAFFEVYNFFEYGHLESVYQRALVVALCERGLRCESEVLFPLTFHGINVGNYRADLVVEGTIIVESKTVPLVNSAHQAQVYNYLRCSRLLVGLLLNFGPKSSFMRFLNPIVLRRPPPAD